MFRGKSDDGRGRGGGGHYHDGDRKEEGKLEGKVMRFTRGFTSASKCDEGDKGLLYN